MKKAALFRLLLCGALLAALIGGAPHFSNPAAAAPDRWLQTVTSPWHGSYVCNQGLTRLQLTLRPLSGGQRWEADFAFAPDPDNPNVPKGSFRLAGSLDRATGQLVLKQQHWLEQPDDASYRMVDLAGALQIGVGQALIRGRVTSYGCEDFAVWQFFADVDGGR